MSLFGDNLVSKPNRTWELVKIGTDERDENTRSLCEKLYTKFSPYGDRDFIKKFQIEFFQKFWEMDLACTLIDSGHNLSEADSGDEGPDVCLLSENGIKMWIEAICPQRGNTKDGVSKPITGHPMSIDSKRIILRLTSAINAKHEQHLKNIEKGICTSNEPYIIAINGCQLTPGPGLDDLTPRIVKALFEGGNDMVSFDTGSESLEQKWCENRSHIEKANKENISLGYFMQQKYSNISAVIYSDSCYASRPSEAGGDYILVHNPFARNPLPEGVFKFGLEYIASKSKIDTEGDYSLKVNNYRCQEYLYSEL
jgi:type I restriction enzyme S subunit